MLTQEQIHFFRANGYLNYGQSVLTDAELADLREALDRTLNGKSAATPELMRNISRGGDADNSVVIQVVNIWQAEDAFRRHLYNERIVRMAAALMGADTVRVWHDQVQVKPPKVGGPTIWHQDHPYWPIIQPADLVSAWVALEDATPENGCMSMVARSHRWGRYKDGTVGIDPETFGPANDPALLPPGERIEVVPVPVKAGSVVFHHCLTWHGAPPNPSPNSRPAIAVHYMPGHTRYEPTAQSHVVEHHVEVAPGEILTGSHFPTVMENGKMNPPPTV